MSQKPLLSIVPYLPEGCANLDTIDVLEDLLDRAKQGQIISVAVAALGPGQAFYTTISECNQPVAMLGAITMLGRHIERVIDAAGHDEPRGG